MRTVSRSVLDTAVALMCTCATMSRSRFAAYHGSTPLLRCRSHCLPLDRKRRPDSGTRLSTKLLRRCGDRTLTVGACGGRCPGVIIFAFAGPRASCLALVFFLLHVSLACVCFADGTMQAYPTSSKKGKDTNWDGINKEVISTSFDYFDCAGLS
jgi:hypothetical protein